MTTIAWDGKILAADSQTTSGDSIAMYANKLIRVKNGWLTGCGTLRDIYKLKDYIEGKLKEVPTDLDMTCFHLTKRSFIRYEADGYPMPMVNFKNLKTATGTGWEWAMAAMDMGKNAIEAVEYAREKDIYTGGKINYVEIFGDNQLKAR